jgi:glycogen synthase
LRLTSEEALQLLEPIFSAAERFPEKAAGFVKWLILGQGNREPAPTLWALWQRFAEDFASSGISGEVDDERSHAGKLLRELFLGVDWGEERDWPPLAGEAHRLQSLFARLLPTRRGFECYGYFLAKAGSKSLPEPLVGIASKLNSAKATPVLNETAVFYLEQILTRLVYGGNTRIRAEPQLRTSTLTILNHLVAAGSSPAYKLRDDFLTPTPA